VLDLKYQVLEENTGEILQDLVIGNDFLNSARKDFNTAQKIAGIDK
jgi:hypothetical protein